jgi:hypothetical protein
MALVGLGMATFFTLIVIAGAAPWWVIDACR